MAGPGWLLFGVGRLQVAASLALDSAVLLGLALAALLCAALLPAPRPLRAGLAVAAVAAVLADNLVFLLGAWEWLVWLGLRGDASRAARWGRGIERIGAVALWLFALVLFFALGGSWSRAGRGFLVDVPGGEFASVGAVHLGPTLSLADIAAQLALVEPGGARPVRALLNDKILLGVPLRPVLVGLLLVGITLRALAPLLSRAYAVALGAVLCGAGLLLRLRGLLVLLVLAVLTLAVGCAPSGGPRLQADPLDLQRQGEAAVLLRNRGAAPLSINLITLSGDSQGFSLTPPPPSVLPPGGTLAVPVRFQAAGRVQGFGALQIRSDDPRGRDEPRTPEPERLIGVPLRVGATPHLWLLLLAPLVAALVSRLRRTRLVPLVGAAVPALGAAWLLARFRSGVGVAEGLYGMQLLDHRTLFRGAAFLPPLELHVGIDGLSLPLVLLVALLPFVLLLLLLGGTVLASWLNGGQEQDQGGTEQRQGGTVLASWRNQRQGGTTDLSLPRRVQGGTVLASWQNGGQEQDGLQGGTDLSLPRRGEEGEGGQRQSRPREPLFNRGGASRLLALQAALLLWLCALDLGLLFVAFVVALWALPLRGWLLRLVPAAAFLLGTVLLYRASLPTLLIDGTPTPHTLDLVRLTYQSYFGGQPLFNQAALPLDRAVYALFAIALLLPLAALLFSRAPQPAALALASLLPVYGLVRLCAGILPEAARGHGAMLAYLGAALVLSGRRDDPAALARRTFGLCLLAIGGFTGAALAGALLLLLSQGLLSALAAALRRPLPSWALAVLPGAPLFPGACLVLFGAFPDQRLATAVALLALLWPRPRTPATPLRPAPPLALALLPVAVLLSLWPAPLLRLSAVSLADVVAHGGLRGAAMIVRR